LVVVVVGQLPKVALLLLQVGEMAINRVVAVDSIGSIRTAME
jgi:hypothetical protein